MQPRRSLRLLAGALVLTVPLISSCGFGKATDRVYVPGEGTNDRSGEVKVLAAVVVSAQPGSGTFIATLSNNSQDVGEEQSFDSLTGAGVWTDLQIDDFEPVEITYRDFVNLADGDGVPIEGDFAPGDVMELTLGYGSGDATTMEVPVVYACDEYTGLDTSVSEASEEPTATDSPSPGEVPSETTSPTATETSAAPDTAAEDTYDCAVVFEE